MEERITVISKKEKELAELESRLAQQELELLSNTFNELKQQPNSSHVRFNVLLIYIFIFFFFQIIDALPKQLDNIHKAMQEHANLQMQLWNLEKHIEKKTKDIENQKELVAVQVLIFKLLN